MKYFGKEKFTLLLAMLLFGMLLPLSSCSRPAQLPAPQNLHMEGQVLVWDNVESAAGYLVYFLEEDHETKLCHYDLSALLEPGTYEVEVMAMGDGKTTRDSDWANFSYTRKGADDTTPHPAEGYDEAGFSYTLLPDGSGYELYRGRSNYMQLGKLILPDTFCGLPVKRIADEAFYYGYLNFDYDTKVLKLPTQLESIGAFALAHIVPPEGVVIPDTVTEIGVGAFDGDFGLKHVTLPRGLKVIPDFCFTDCGLAELRLPPALEEIGIEAFRFSPEWLSHSHLYKSSTDYTSVQFPSTLKSIGAQAFAGTSLDRVTLPQGLAWADRDIFDGTPWYEAQPDGFVTIGERLYKYKGDPGERITLPGNIKKIMGGAFFSQWDVLEISIPDGVTFMGPDTFAMCNSLERIRLPADLKELPGRSFVGCDALTDLTLPAGLESIGEDAFMNCDGLRSITLPAGLKVIGDTVFFECEALQELLIPASVEHIGLGPCFRCTALERVYYEGTQAAWETLLAEFNQTDESLAEAPFAQAVCYFYSPAAPTAPGNYWHYENGTPAIW